MLSTHTRSATRTKLLAEISALSSEITVHSHELSDALLTTVNREVQSAYNAEKGIEDELCAIERLLLQHEQTTRNWVALLNRLKNGLKELGDVENWAGVLAEFAEDIGSILKSTQATST